MVEMFKLMLIAFLCLMPVVVLTEMLTMLLKLMLSVAPIVALVSAEYNLK